MIKKFRRCFILYYKVVLPSGSGVACFWKEFLAVTLTPTWTLCKSPFAPESSEAKDPR